MADPSSTSQTCSGPGQSWPATDRQQASSSAESSLKQGMTTSTAGHSAGRVAAAGPARRWRRLRRAYTRSRVECTSTRVM